MNVSVKFCVATLALVLVPSLAGAEEPPTRKGDTKGASVKERAHRRVKEGLLNPLVSQDSERSRFSRVVQPPRERRLRILQATTKKDKEGREFVPYEIDVSYGDEWHTDVAGCVYTKSGRIYVQRDDEYRPAEFLLGKDVPAVSGVCEVAAPRERA